MNENHDNTKERIDRLHNEIIDWIDNRPLVEKHAKELYDLLTTHTHLNDNPSHAHDLMLLYQVFILLHDEKKQAHCEQLLQEYYTKSYELIKNQSYEEYNKTFDKSRLPYDVISLLKDSGKSEQEVQKIINKSIEHTKLEDENDYLKYKNMPIKDIILDHISGYFVNSSYYKRKTLWHYCFDTQKEYDEYVNIHIVYLANMYFKHNRTPKDLFHSDHTYIIDSIELDLKKDIAIEKNPDDPILYYIIELETPQSLPDIDLRASSEYKMYSVQIAYKMRTLYSKKEYTEQENKDYELERALFDRVLFNKITLIACNNVTKKYLEPENIMGMYLENILSRRELKKSEWIGLYFTSKELDLDRFQTLFFMKTKNQKRYENFMWDNLSSVLTNTPIFSKEFLDAFHKGSYYPALLFNKAIHHSLSNNHKTFIKGLLFICMWEKLYFRHIKPKHLDDLSTQSQENKSFSEVIEECIDYRSTYSMDTLFVNESIENLSTVFKEVTKFLNMSEEGFDYSFLALEGEIEDINDILLLLYNFSRIEREAIPYTISFINLLRERQKEKFIIKKTNDKNHLAIKQIDIGFNINNFETTLEPIRDTPILKNIDINNQYMYIDKTIKFICETDKGAGIPNLEFFEKSLDTVYLYKIRNQMTHFSNDENIENLMTNTKNLLLTLIKGYFKYLDLFNKITDEWVNLGIYKRMMRDRPFRMIPPFYVMRHTQKLIQILCLVISVKNKDKFSEEEIQSLRFTYINDDWEKTLNTLKDFIEKTEPSKLKIDNFDLSKDQQDELGKIYLNLYDLKPENKDTENFDAYLLNQIHELIRYIVNLNKIILSLLNFLFSSNSQNYMERTQLDTFLRTYHGESAYYILYLAQHFCRGVKADEKTNN